MREGQPKGCPFLWDAKQEGGVMNSELGVIILAAGLGKRMKSDKAKVLHEVCGSPMIQHVVRTAARLAGSQVVVVVGHQAERVQQAVAGVGKTFFALQAQQLGTGHAVLCAMPQLPQGVRHVVILCGDVPLIGADTLNQLVTDHLAQRRDVTLLAVQVPDPKGYGRVLLNAGGGLNAIVEEADADESQKKIDLVNSGIYVVKRSFLEAVLPRLGTDNAQKEMYLTDIIGYGYRENKIMGAVLGNDSNEVIGINSRTDLQRAEEVMRLRIIQKP
jgi:UDP-N-acetylglucosamine diphosphorylase/glucosamine-1-phosphate N-acetyltransferase